MPDETEKPAVEPQTFTRREQAFADWVAALGELSNPPRSKEAKIPTRGGGSFSYKYADIGEILSHVRPILAKHNLAISQPVLEIDGAIHLRTVVSHASGINVVDGEDTLPISSMAALADPQEFGKRMTYFRRYVLSSVLGIAAEDDDDAQGVDPSKRETAPPAKRAPVPAQRPPSGGTYQLGKPPASAAEVEKEVRPPQADDDEIPGLPQTKPEDESQEKWTPPGQLLVKTESVEDPVERLNALHELMRNWGFPAEDEPKAIAWLKEQAASIGATYSAKAKKWVLS